MQAGSCSWRAGSLLQRLECAKLQSLIRSYKILQVRQSECSRYCFRFISVPLFFPFLPHKPDLQTSFAFVENWYNRVGRPPKTTTYHDYQFAQCYCMLAAAPCCSWFLGMIDSDRLQEGRYGNALDSMDRQEEVSQEQKLPEKKPARRQLPSFGLVHCHLVPPCIPMISNVYSVVHQPAANRWQFPWRSSIGASWSWICIQVFPFPWKDSWLGHAWAGRICLRMCETWWKVFPISNSKFVFSKWCWITSQAFLRKSRCLDSVTPQESRSCCLKRNFFRLYGTLNSVMRQDYLYFPASQGEKGRKRRSKHSQDAQDQGASKHSEANILFIKLFIYIHSIYIHMCVCLFHFISDVLFCTARENSVEFKDGFKKFLSQQPSMMEVQY